MRYFFPISIKSLKIDLPEYTDQTITGAIYLADSTDSAGTVTVTKQTTAPYVLDGAHNANVYELSLTANPTTIERGDVITIYNADNRSVIHNVREVNTNALLLFESLDSSFATASLVASNTVSLTWTVTLTEGDEYRIILTYVDLSGSTKTLNLVGIATSYQSDPPISIADIQLEYRNIYELVSKNINIKKIISNKWNNVILHKLWSYVEQGVVLNSMILREVLLLEVVHQILLGVRLENQDIQYWIEEIKQEKIVAWDNLMSQLIIVDEVGTRKDSRQSVYSRSIKRVS